jgi:murein DD-endopeptidase MepM/ murein hydrolase activator NlpD
VSARAVVATAVVLGLLPSFAVAAPPKEQPKTVEKKPPAVIHEVQRGETLAAIAKYYNVTVSSLVIGNNLKGGPRAKLTPGQMLTIPQRPGAAVPIVKGRKGKPAGPEPQPVSLVLSVPTFEEEAPMFMWPAVGHVSSTFGRRGRSWHRGVDIQAESGSPVVASAAGVVIASGWEHRYGQRVKIEHEGGFITLYAHNERNLVEVGQEVRAGQVIAAVGRTGRATGDHVHFEIRLDGRVYNPLYLLPLPSRPVQVDLVATDKSDDDE